MTSQSSPINVVVQYNHVFDQQDQSSHLIIVYKLTNEKVVGFNETDNGPIRKFPSLLKVHAIICTIWPENHTKEYGKRYNEKTKTLSHLI